MATKVVMAKLSPTMEEGRVLHWLKKEGDVVEVGDVVVEIETDKANMDVEALGSGVLRRVLVEEGATVPTGTLIGVIAAQDEEISEIIAAAAPAIAGDGTGAPEAQSGAETAPPEATPAAPAAAPAAPLAAASTTDGGRIKASPVARRIAEERGIDLRQISGSGPGGRIVKRDVEAAAATPAPGAPGAPGAAPAAATAFVPPVGAEVPFEHVELSQIRKAIARNTAQSLGPVPHFFLTNQIDMSRVLKFRAELNRSLEDSGIKVGVNDILMKVAALALAEHPNVNVSFAGDHIRRFTRVDVGLAVAIPDGLITPVVRSVGAKGLRQIAVESRELIERARAKKLMPDEYQGATFTISNLGPWGIDEFTAVINPPAATILAVGATQDQPVAIDGSLEIRPRMRVTLSCDHRAVDGVMGAEFLATFKSMLENPLRLIA